MAPLPVQAGGIQKPENKQVTSPRALFLTVHDTEHLFRSDVSGACCTEAARLLTLAPGILDSRCQSQKPRTWIPSSWFNVRMDSPKEATPARIGESLIVRAVLRGF